ncbi:hypothetical protein IEQ34_012320 [Dendrobium chrysotoxum]|uniref:Pyridoxamine 5'-phosphate oxidase putative domain-containing protein n=1 Tax=Dendrobium chrysotoxum TaxID=161865 RepID=A0AAV7GS85_DENCH|nr:hypothetical protein IEQ34_012320 [Dendrobium chrysotoxum]
MDAIVSSSFTSWRAEPYPSRHSCVFSCHKVPSFGQCLFKTHQKSKFPSLFSRRSGVRAVANELFDGGKGEEQPFGNGSALHGVELKHNMDEGGMDKMDVIEKEVTRPYGANFHDGSTTRAGLFRTPISGGLHSATFSHDLPPPALAVRNLMEQARFAHLCTVMSRMHHRRAGYPCGSLVDYATDSMGHPIFSLSPLAIHTRNLLADSRCTLVVQIPGWSGLSNARATIFGDAIPLPADKQGLIAKDLLGHSDMDVKICIASYLIEITRITAPNAPYDADIIKEILGLIVGAFKNLNEMSSRSFPKRVSILETHFPKTIRPKHSDIVFSSMITIMTFVLEETESIFAHLLSCLLDDVKVVDKNILHTVKKLAEKVLVNYSLKQKSYLAKLFNDKGPLLMKIRKLTINYLSGSFLKTRSDLHNMKNGNGVSMAAKKNVEICHHSSSQLVMIIMESANSLPFPIPVVLISCPPHESEVSLSTIVNKHVTVLNAVFNYLMHFRDIYFIGGFGTVQWIDVKDYEDIQPDKIAADGGEQNLKELNAIFSKPLKAILSTEGEIDDVAFISIDSKGTDVRVRQGAQFNIQRLSFEEEHGVHTLEDAKKALQRIVSRGSKSRETYRS